MTSRAEYRLLLRQDNADRRLTELGYEIGLVTEERHEKFIQKKNRIDAEISRLKTTHRSMAELNDFLIRHGENETETNLTLYEIIKRPGISYESTAEIDEASRPELTRQERYNVEVMIKYDGYIKKQLQQVEKLNKLENKRLDSDLNYNEIRGLRIEARQKLEKIKPRTLGQASRISGVSPADIGVLTIYLEKKRRERE